MTVPHRDATQVADLSTEEVLQEATELARQMASLAANFALRTVEIDRREAWRLHGATSLESWMVERLGFAYPTAKAHVDLARRLGHLPHLRHALTGGELSIDQARAAAGMATSATDEAVTQQAKDMTIRQLRDLAASRNKPTPQDEQTAHAARAVRFNDTFRTITAQLPHHLYHEARTILEEEAKRIHSDGETRWDQRLADALMALVRGSRRVRGHVGGSSHTLVLHAPLPVLVDPDSSLCAEFERGGLVSAEVVHELLCDATVIIAGDDRAGHTMYEGRAQRFATETQRREIWRRDRHCRFPGCDHTLFVIAHHLFPWQYGGTTDLPNLALLCDYHHHLVHSKAWDLSGDANGTLYFVGPTGEIMTSEPSPLWNLVTAPELELDERPDDTAGTKSARASTSSEDLDDSG